MLVSLVVFTTKMLHSKNPKLAIQGTQFLHSHTPAPSAHGEQDTPQESQKPRHPLSHEGRSQLGPVGTSCGSPKASEKNCGNTSWKAGGLVINHSGKTEVQHITLSLKHFLSHMQTYQSLDNKQSPPKSHIELDGQERVVMRYGRLDDNFLPHKKT